LPLLIYTIRSGQYTLFKIHIYINFKLIRGRKQMYWEPIFCATSNIVAQLLCIYSAIFLLMNFLIKLFQKTKRSLYIRFQIKPHFSPTKPYTNMSILYWNLVYLKYILNFYSRKKPTLHKVGFWKEKKYIIIHIL